MSEAPRTTESAAAADAPRSLAPHHLRLFALMVDVLLAVMLINLVQRLAVGEGWDLHAPLPGGEAPWPRALGAALLLLLRDLPAGQSPGKWFMGLAVASAADPARLPPVSARILRNVTLVLLPVEAVLVFVDPFCRRLGDRLAGTVLVLQARPAPATRRLLGMAILFMASTLAIFLLEFWNVRRSAAYPLALRIAAEDAAVTAAFGADVELSAPELTRSPDGTRMHVRLSAEGKGSEGHVTVAFTRAEDPLRWEPGPVVVETPPDNAPAVQDAPPREYRR